MKEHLVIIEDDPFLKEFYEFVFKRINVRVTILEDGDKFIELLSEEEISLILMDINLKNTTVKGERVDGVFLSRYVKENSNFSHIPVLIVSAYSLDKSNRKLFVDSLADDYFTKPITDINYFLSHIKKIMQKSCQKIEY
jgi:DNA-binding response OmpR family regulator